MIAAYFEIRRNNLFKVLPYLIFIVLIYCSGCINNKNAIKDKQADELVEIFFTLYKNKGHSIALDYLFKGDGTLGIEQYSSLKDSLYSIEQISGLYLDKELITKQMVGESLVLYSYLVKYENRPLRFLLMFYKANTQWKIYRFRFDSDIEEELQESAKVYFLYK